MQLAVQVSMSTGESWRSREIAKTVIGKRSVIGGTIIYGNSLDRQLSPQRTKQPCAKSSSMKEEYAGGFGRG